MSAATATQPHLRRTSRRADARVALGFAAGALIEPYRPLMVNLIVTRRCNLSCGYCREYDHVSAPVPLDALKERIEHLARLRTVLVTLTGGESLLHPQLADIVRFVRERRMTPAVNTNGFLLTAARIAALNEAGLYAMQLSVDAVEPNDVTKKVLRPLLPKLRLLAAHARFRVRVNTVLGAAPPDEALEVVRVVMSLGFDAKCSLLRHGDGTVRSFDAQTRAVYADISRIKGRSLPVLGESFQDELVREGHADWKCRAGARFFHVCENGLVHLCAPRYGEGAKPLAEYTETDLRSAFDAPKPCAAACPVAYAHQVSRVDALRPQKARVPSSPSH